MKKAATAGRLDTRGVSRKNIQIADPTQKQIAYGNYQNAIDDFLQDKKKINDNTKDVPPGPKKDIHTGKFVERTILGTNELVEEAKAIKKK